MKYRRLAVDELKELEPEFIRFLAANSIPGPDWEKMLKSSPDKANQFIDQFSDIVMERTLKNIKYLEYRTKDDIKVFNCKEDNIVLMGLMIDGESPIDLRKDLQVAEMVASLNQSNATLKTYRAEKTYSKEREVELFEMLENGCMITNEKLFDSIKNLQKA